MPATDYTVADLRPVREFSGETYLKLAALDVEDTDAMALFLTDYGALRVRGEANDWQRLGLPFEDETRELKVALNEVPEARTDWSIETLVEVQWAIWTMRDLVACWRALSGEIDPFTHAWESPLRQGREPYEDFDGPASFLAWTLWASLTEFSPRLFPIAPGEKRPPVFHAFSTGSWQACCLELFNHIVEEASYKTCENETCQRLFVRQEGRSEHGQHRSRGVKYCSSLCARSQAQRQYRRRKRGHPRGV